MANLPAVHNLPHSQLLVAYGPDPGDVRTWAAGGVTAETWVSIAVALIAAVAILAAALVTAYATARRERAARAAEHDAVILRELLQAALDLRDLLGEPMGGRTDGGNTQRAQAAFRVARVAARRIDVRDRARAWEAAAVGRFTESMGLDEATAWRDLVDAVGRGLRDC